MDLIRKCGNGLSWVYSVLSVAVMFCLSPCMVGGARALGVACAALAFCVALFHSASAQAAVTLTDLSAVLDPEDFATAVATKIATYWAVALVALFAIAAIAFFVNYMFSRPKRAAK